MAQKLPLLDTLCGISNRYYEFHDRKRSFEGTQVSRWLALDNVIWQESRPVFCREQFSLVVIPIMHGLTGHDQEQHAIVAMYCTLF